MKMKNKRLNIIFLLISILLIISSVIFVNEKTFFSKFYSDYYSKSNVVQNQEDNQSLNNSKAQLSGTGNQNESKNNLNDPKINPDNPALPATAATPPANNSSRNGQVISDGDEQQALNLYNQGLKVYYARDFDQALSLFNQALKLNPDCYQALNGKGATEAFLGNYTEGIGLIRQAISLNPNFEYAHFNLGLAFELAGRWDEAIAAYQEAISLDVQDAWAYYGIASIYGRQGNVESTAAYLKQAIRIEPDARETAKTEHDFDNVRSSPVFQELLKPVTSISLDQTAGTSKNVGQSQPIAAPQKATQIPILYYHSVMAEPGNELRMPPEQFNDQMAYLSSRGYHVVTPDELYNGLYNEGKLPDKPIMITFDDGYTDNYTNALPILKKYNFTATVFMVSKFVNQKGFLSLEQLKELQSAGWTIGGHTCNHSDLAKVDSNTAWNELSASKADLEKILGQPIKYFCYPFGGYNQDVVNQVKQNGYLMALTTDRGWVSKASDPYLLHRVYCYANMGLDEFVKRITDADY